MSGEQILVAVLGITLMFMVLFRKQISRVILDTESWGFWGLKVKTRAPEQNKAAAEAATANIKGAAKGPLERTEPTINLPTGPQTPPPALTSAQFMHREVEASIRADPKFLAAPDDKTKIDLLVAHHASTNIQLAFERIYRIIFGSQVRALRAANRPGGVPTDIIRQIFAEAQTQFPGIHGSQTFDQWAAFLLQTGLGMELPPQNGKFMASITVRGHYFLTYLHEMGLPDPPG
ncbi:MAG TPA: hypothetical protein VFB13_17475 [Reyranella sp.]|jgi:hypothetical protein|nr:hypothetical protein [Reyranella sp.]